MLKVGIYFNDLNPETGGASSLTKTIQNEIVTDKDDRFEYVFIYDGKPSAQYKIERDGYLYVNYFAKTLRDRSCRTRIKNFIKRNLRMGQFDGGRWDIIAKNENIDIFYFPVPGCYDTDYPFIYTVWDLGHRTTPYFPEVSRIRTIVDRDNMYFSNVYRARYILTGNEEGKKEILTNYPMPPHKIVVNPFPVASFCRGSEKKPEFDLPDQYFFYPAQFWPHKNHICILNALVSLRIRYGLKPKVFFTGSDKGNRKYIDSKIKEYGLENQVVFTGFVSDEELKYLYTHATAMIFASLMGPNNMPPVEGTFLNCPVIITDLDGHKEQLGDTALYFNGYKPEELAEHMKSMLLDSAARNEIKRKQLTLAEKFDRINYFAGVKTILEEFNLARQTWGEDYPMF